MTPNLKRHKFNYFKNYKRGTSLAVQWLALCASNAGGVGSIPGWGTRIPHAARGSKKNKKIKKLQALFIKGLCKINEKEKIFAIHTNSKGVVSRTHKELL